MNPVDFPERNAVFVAVGCDNLPACRQHNEQFGADEIISCWELSDKDCVEILKQIKADRRPAVYLAVIGGQPTVSLWVRENDNNYMPADKRFQPLS